jgi:outer membrane protein W
MLLRISLFLFLLLPTCSLNAQFMQGGDFLIGSTVGFSSTSSKVSQSSTIGTGEKTPRALQINLNPNIGYFLTDDFALGIGLDYTYSHQRDADNNRRTDSDFLFGPFVRYYLPVQERMAFFGVLDFGFGNSSNENLLLTGNESVSSNIFAVGVGPGFTILSSNSIGIEAIFKYNFARSKFNTELGGVSTSTTTNTNQFDVSLGVQFYFGGLVRTKK